MTSPIRALRQIGNAGGRHRRTRQKPDGAVVDQRFVTCAPCGGVESAATVHGDGVFVLCAEGHVQDGGAS